jgi:hypothetical protein
MTDAGSESVGRTAYLAELQCFLCGSLAGSIEIDRKPLPPYGIWHPAGGEAPQPVADWRQLRCGRCGGALFAESIEAILKPDPDDDELQREMPRRGRPPKWLVEQRRRERDAAESRLG